LKNFIRIKLLVLSLSLFAGPALGQEGVSIEGGSGSVSDGFLAGVHVFFFEDSSSLGDQQLNDGSSTFTRFDMQYNFTDYFTGFGLFSESNVFGEDQEDTVSGWMLELFAGSFFFKYMAGMSVEQTFQNRSFATRKGTSTATEIGIRAPLFGGFSFYEVAYHVRTITIDTEDGVPMDSVYTLTQSMPMLSMGVSL
jgi:hypothetical protein